VFDNTDVPKGGGSPVGPGGNEFKSVRFTPHPRLQAKTPEPTEDKPYSVGETPASVSKTPGFEGILAVFALVTLVLRRR